ncbi:MAG: hypothetical protein ACAH95_06470 [Fimbriimonas sp.]
MISFRAILICLSAAQAAASAAWLQIAPDAGSERLLKQVADAVRKYKAKHRRWPVALGTAGIRRDQLISRANHVIRTEVIYTIEPALARNLDPKDLGFDPKRDPIARMPYVKLPTPSRTIDRRIPDGKGGWRTYKVRSVGLDAKVKVLGVLLDGTVKWVDMIDPWEKKLPALPAPPAVPSKRGI